MSGMTNCGVGRRYLVGGHREGVNVTLFRWVAIREVKLRRIQQFGGHVTDDSGFGCCRTTWLYDCGVGYYTRYPEVPQAYGTLVSYQDVSLDRMDIDACPKPGTSSALTGLISLCTMLSECRYSRPQAACASYQGRSLSLSLEIIWIAYQVQSIGPRIFLSVLGDVSVLQPRGDDAKREQGLGNSEEG